MRRPNDMLPIGRIAERTGLAVSAIRYYEAEGLVRPTRSEAGQRQFRRSDIRRISFVKIAQELGFTLAEIRAEMTRLPEGRTPTKSDWAKISRAFRTRLDTRIAELERTRDKLDGCIGCGCLSLKVCALYNPGDVAGAQGAGPRNIIEGK